MNLQVKQLQLKQLIKEKVQSKALIPLSFAQERIWFLTKLDDKSAVFNIPFAFEIQGVVTIEYLQKALEVVINRHVGLTVTMETKKHVPYQRISENSRQAILETITVRNENDLQEQLQLFAETPIQLEVNQAYYNIRLFKLSEDNYVFALVIHHIIFDGWSMNIFMKELAIVYRAISSSLPIQLPEIRTNYLEAVLEERIVYKATKFKKGLAYWREKLSDCNTVLDVSYQKSVSNKEVYKGGQKRLLLSTELVSKLKKVTTAQKRTLFSLFMSVYQTLLYRFSNQENIAVGYSVANRNHKDIEHTIGFFVNTLVAYSKIEHFQSFEILWKQVHQQLLADLAYSNVPFSKIVNELNPSREGTHSPFFQTMLVFNNFSIPDLSIEGISIKPREIKTNQSAFFQTLYINPKNESYECVLEYNKNLFSEATITSFLTAFETMLTAIIENVQTPLGKLPLLPFKNKLIEEKYLTLKEETIVSTFKKIATSYPDKKAVFDTNTIINYKELDVVSDRLASYLLDQNFPTQSRIGVSLTPSTNIPIVLLGILKAGCIYVPIDPSYPTARKNFCITESNIILVIAETISEITNIPVLFIDENENWKSAIIRKEFPKISRLALAYILFTSGSTNQPKPVLGTHNNTMHRLEWMWKKYPFMEDEVAIHRVSLNFVDAIWELFGPLLKGVPVRIATTEERLNLSSFIHLIKKESITRLTVVPSLLKALLQNGFTYENINSLKLCIVSGEKLPQETANRFIDAFPKVQLLNLYGSTEVAGDVSYWEIEAKTTEEIPIGYPIEGNTFYVLDKNLEPLPTGFTGELYVTGTFLSNGYENARETSEKFIPSPFKATHGQRLFKTGDLIQKMENGAYLYQGRIDNLITIRGYRINPLEIEAVLKTQFPAIHNVIVLQRIIQGNEVLVAFLQFNKSVKESIRLDKREFSSKLSEVVPTYMIPDIFVSLPEFPVLYNGKIDRKGFPTDIPVEKKVQISETLSETEQKIYQIWKEALDIEVIQRDSNFFDLGGHSLLLQLIQPKISEALGREISILELFQNTTIKDIAEIITTNKNNKKVVLKEASKRANKRKALLARKSQKTKY